MRKLWCNLNHPSEKAMAPHSSTLLPGKSCGWRSLVGCSPWGGEESDTTGRLHFNVSLSCIGEGNGNPLQCSCLENPRDWGAWWAAVYGVTESRTWLKWLSSSSLYFFSLITYFLPFLVALGVAAAAAAKLLQSCPTLCDPIDSSPPGSPVPGILQARTLEWIAISFYLGVELGYLFDFFLFLEVCLYCYELSPEHCFYSVPQVLGVVFSFSFISVHILISFLISSVICWLFRSVFFNLHMLEFLIVFLL